MLKNVCWFSFYCLISIILQNCILTQFQPAKLQNLCHIHKNMYKKKRILYEKGAKSMKIIFFIKNILWIEKNVVPLHAELRTYVRVAIKNAFLLINLGG